MTAEDERDFAAWFETLELDATAPLDATMSFDFATRGQPSSVTSPREALPRESLELLQELGKGGMGVVHLARQHSLDREVAVKTTREDATAHASGVLLREALLTGRLEHPNVVPVHTLGSDDRGNPQIVMKRIAGTPWIDLLAREPALQDVVTLNRNLEVLLQVCSAVRFAHSRGVVHRDIKPQNVMVGEFDEVYLLDWGIAISVGGEDAVLPREDDAVGLVGTPGFMAPEMIHGDPAQVDERTDVYLLGSTLHWMLTGGPRHDGDSAFDVIHAAWRSEPFDYGAEVPDELGEIANRACRKDPAERFPTVDAFRDALDDYRLHRESIELSHQARERLAELAALIDADNGTERDSPAIHDLFGECRFGFREALRMWPGNQDARSGLQNGLTVMARYHIGRQNLAAARACVAKLPDDDPELQEALEHLEERLAEEAADLERLKRLERDHDLGRGMISRGRVAFVLAIVWTATSAWTAWLTSFEGLDYAAAMHRHMLAGVRNVLVVALLAVVFRTRVFVNRANRRLMYLLFGVMFSVMLVRWGSWWLQADLVAARAADYALFGFAAAMAGLLSDKRIAVLSVLFYGALVGSVFWPSAQLWFGTAANFLFFMALAWIWRRRPEEER